MNFSEYCRNNFGYETKTTFWEDFEIADRFGIYAIKDTFNRAFKEWKTNVEYLTELVIVLNHRLWMHYEAGNEFSARIYDELWDKAHSWACNNLKGEDAEYYFRITG